MQFGYCVNMAATDPEGIGAHRIVEIMEIGFDYVELPLAQVMTLSTEAFAAGLLRMLRDAGIPCACMNNFFPAAYRLTGPDADRTSALAYADRALDHAAALGADRVVFGSSGARNVPDGFDLDHARSQLADLLSELAPLAARRGIMLVIEPLNRIESNIINTLAEGLALARAVSDHAVACLVDFYHAGLAGDPCASVAEAGPLLRHVHLARTLGRSIPVSPNEEPYRSFFSALRAAGYDASLSLEAYAPDDFQRRAARALSLMRTLWAETEK